MNFTSKIVGKMHNNIIINNYYDVRTLILFIIISLLGSFCWNNKSEKDADMLCL